MASTSASTTEETFAREVIRKVRTSTTTKGVPGIVALANESEMRTLEGVSPIGCGCRKGVKLPKAEPKQPPEDKSK